MMEAVFLKLLNMSVAAGWLILTVIVLRLFMKKAPKWAPCILWAIVAARLICPFSLESPFSLIPSAEFLSPYAVQYAKKPSITSGIPALNHRINPVFGDSFSPAPGTSVNPLQIWIFLASIVWFLGLVGLICCALVSFLRVRRTIQEAVLLRENVWLCDNIDSPFILGIFRPKIYVSSSIDEKELDYVLAHENAHLKRRDHWWKPLGYLLLSVYWFHPLVWAAYMFFCQDIELACDEKVIKDMDMKGKKAYSHALVSCSMHRRLITACPLAFGESNVKGRIHMVLHYKKPTFWMIAAAVAVCLFAAVCFLTNPAERTDLSNAEKEGNYAVPPMIMVDGRYYYDTGRISSRTNHKKELDGEITSTVNASEKPQTNNESNFGTGYGYQYGDDHTIEVNRNGTWTVFESYKGDDSMIPYQGQWYCKEDLSEDTIEWLHSYNRLSPEEQLAINFVPWDLYELAGYKNGSDAPVTLETNAETDSNDMATDDTNSSDREMSKSGDESEDETTDSDLNMAIYAAIMEKKKGSYFDDYDFACCDFLMLETVSATPSLKNTAHTVVCYGWALYQQYTVTENGLENAGGSHIPTALTFELDHNNYILKEYWEPRDGSYYVSDIRNKFLAHLVDDGIDSQKFVIQQIQSCYSQAVQSTGLDVDSVISHLIDTLCSGPGSSFDPQSISGQNNSQYRELIYYGEYTLRYCFHRFNDGGETGLKGKIMALICEELLQTRGILPVNAADAATGQFWYEKLLAYEGMITK